MHAVEPSHATSPGSQGTHTVPLRRAPAGQRSHRVWSGDGFAPDGHSTHEEEPAANWAMRSPTAPQNSHGAVESDGLK